MANEVLQHFFLRTRLPVDLGVWSNEESLNSVGQNGRRRIKYKNKTKTQAHTQKGDMME